MGSKIVSLVFFIGCIVFLVWFAFDRRWPIYAAAFCFLISVVTLAVSIFARRGSTVWQGRGKG